MYNWFLATLVRHSLLDNQPEIDNSRQRWMILPNNSCKRNYCNILNKSDSLYKKREMTEKTTENEIKIHIFKKIVQNSL